MRLRKCARLFSVLLVSTVIFTGILPHDVRAASPASGPRPLPAITQDDPFFGVVQAIHDGTKAEALGVSWQRLVVWWSNMQPDGPNSWDANGWFARSAIEDQQAQGIEPVGLILHTPEWAIADDYKTPDAPPINLDLPYDDPNNYWGQFCMRLAGEYAGLVDTWVIWNEPEHSWTGTAAQFAQLQRVAYQAIKAANPNAQVVLTGTTYWEDQNKGQSLLLGRILKELMALPGAAENGGYFDAVSVHQYSNPLNSYTVPIIYRQLLAQYGLEKPMWFDESNVVPYDDPLAPLARGGLRATMEEQASYVIQSVALARAAGIERYAIYKMVDGDAENGELFGLVRDDGTVRPAYVAYQVAARELAGVSDAVYFWGGSATPPTADEVTALLASVGEYPQFVWPAALNGVRMARGDDRVTVLWNASAEDLEVGVPSGAATAEVIDKYGNSTTVTRQADGAFHLELAAATNNTDARDTRLVLVGGDPLILVEPGMADHRDAYPREIDAAWGVPGALLPPEPTIEEAWVAPTGYAVSGPWLEFYRAHGGEDYFGYPRSPVVADPLNPEQCVQYFQRVVLEWHPDNPEEYRIQRRLLSEELGGQAADEAPATQANSADYWYFPKGDGGLGHAVSNYAPDGTWIGFKSYFDGYGREDAFGYPMEPPTQREDADGTLRWTQRFQAAYFEYHQEYDLDGTKPGTDILWRTWTVQLRLLGDEYLSANDLPYVSGDPAEHHTVPPSPWPES